MWPEEFSKGDCDQIISKGQKLLAQEAAMVQKGKKIDNEKRSSKVRWIERGDKNDLNNLFSMFDKYFEFANLHFRFDLTRFKSFQFTEYNQGDHYTWHSDWFLETKNKYQRKLSLTMQLTDPSHYDGGDFQFHELDDGPDVRLLRKQGTILVFPSYLVHRIRLVTRGCRHSLVAWYEGPEFR